SFEDAMGAKDAQELFEEFIRELERRGFTPRRGRFGEHMVVSLDNDGPVTIIIDTEEKF
ncbi:MAG TPA: D-tyrosyl-tRNA(Tyr) deacylase, partial [Candidatus Omnitrophica bacterium]|nr:D-tyrosyl-tRNA(Tyr) deacylase [Candidatus Omnitrophota bacterium]